MKLSITEAAAIVGAKESEIREVDGDLVTTTDGTTVRVGPTASGAIGPVSIINPSDGYAGPLQVEIVEVEIVIARPKGRRAKADDLSEEVDA